MLGKGTDKKKRFHRKGFFFFKKGAPNLFLLIPSLVFSVPYLAWGHSPGAYDFYFYSEQEPNSNPRITPTAPSYPKATQLTQQTQQSSHAYIPPLSLSKASSAHLRSLNSRQTESLFFPSSCLEAEGGSRSSTPWTGFSPHIDSGFVFVEFLT